MPVFQRERLDQTWTDMQPLLQRHWLEIAHYADIPLSPDLGMYQAIEAAGSLRIYTARAEDAERTLLGYAVFFCRTALHYSGSKQASNDVIFLSPEFRKGGLGKELIQFADAQLAAEGVQVVYHHVKFAHDWSPLLERMGYVKQDIILSRRLDTIG